GTGPSLTSARDHDVYPTKWRPVATKARALCDWGILPRAASMTNTFVIRSGASRRVTVQEAREIVDVQQGRVGREIAVCVWVPRGVPVNEASKVVDVQHRYQRGLIAV